MRLLPKSGYATITGPGVLREADTYTCVHCNGVRNWRSSDPELPVDAGGHCRKCDAAICTPCADYCDAHGCTPFLKKIEEHEARMRLRDAITR